MPTTRIASAKTFFLEGAKEVLIVLEAQGVFNFLGIRSRCAATGRSHRAPFWDGFLWRQLFQMKNRPFLPFLCRLASQPASLGARSAPAHGK